MNKFMLIKKVQETKDYIVMDLETTGFAPISIPYGKYTCGIIEISAVKYKDGVEVERFDELVDPQTQIPKKITELTGISQGMVTGKRSIGPVLEDFRKFSEGEIIIAHNASFEKRFMDYYMNLCGYKFDNQMLDTYAIAKIINPGLKSKKLGDLCNHYGIELSGAHRAINDVLATGELFRKLQEGANSIDLQDIEFEEEKEEVDEEIPDLKIISKNKWEKKYGNKIMKRTYLTTDKGTIFFDHSARMWHYKNYAPSNQDGDIASREGLLPIISKVKEVLREQKNS